MTDEQKKDPGDIPTKLKLRGEHLKKILFEFLLHTEAFGFWMATSEFVAFGGVTGSPQVVTIVDKVTECIYQFAIENGGIDLHQEIVQSEPEHMSKIIAEGLELPYLFMTDTAQWIKQ